MTFAIGDLAGGRAACRSLTAALLLAAGGAGPARGAVVVTVFPRIQLVRQGASVELKARVRGGRSDGGLAWKVLEPGRGTLESVGPGRVRYTAADPVEPWSRVVVRAASIEAPAAFQDAVIEVLPNAVFLVIEQVLGKDWIEQGAVAGPSPVRLEVVEPGLFSWAGSYTLHAEVDTGAEDRFDWDVQPDEGELVFLASSGNARESARYLPPPARSEGTTVRVRVRCLANPRHAQDVRIYLPATGAYLPEPESPRDFFNWLLGPERLLHPLRGPYP